LKKTISDINKKFQSLNNDQPIENITSLGGAVKLFSDAKI